MPQVLIRDIEPEVLERLKARARAHGRSLQAELRTVLQEAARADRDAVIASLAEFRRQWGDRVFSDSTEFIREDRDHAH